MSTDPTPHLSTGIEALATHCLYRIATGRWLPGARLPSVRTAEIDWKVDRRVILAAYRRLVQAGLVEVRDRSGYYVAGGERHGELESRRERLATCHQHFEQELADLGLSPLASFRYLAHLAELREHERPTTAFVECTQLQADGHAREILERLGLPCQGLTLAALTTSGTIPPSVRTLLVSAFHVGELKECMGRDRALVTVPLAVSDELAAELPSDVERALLFESDPTEAEAIAADVRRTGFPLEVAAEVAQDVDAALRQRLGKRSLGSTLALLSPRLWGSVAQDWREHPRVRQVGFRIHPDAWPRVIEALGLPLGGFTAATRSAGLEAPL
jgi:DNA-binding transcriptional regulator YhcF (GntR family)